MELATTALEDLIKALEEQRKKRQLDHSQFSKLLGMSASYWSMILNGERKPNRNILAKFIQNLPEVTSEAIIYDLYTLRQGNDDTIQKGE